jgi:hypothetical protein
MSIVQLGQNHTVTEYYHLLEKNELLLSAISHNRKRAAIADNQEKH